MKHLLHLITLMFAVILFTACEKEFPNPEMPDLSSVPSDNISPFELISPAGGVSLTVFQPNDNQVTISWQETKATGDRAVTYEWIADNADGNFSTPLLAIPSGNEGLDTEVTLTLGQIDAALAEIGVEVGTALDLKWTIRATAGTDVRLANTPRKISVRRGGLTIEVYVPNNTPADQDVYLAGMFEFAVGQNWQTPGSQPGLKMTNIGGGRYSITIAPPANGATFEYKYFLATAAAPNWGNGERKPTSGGNNDGGGIRNRRLTYQAGNDLVSDVVSIWEGYPYDHIVFKATLPESTPLFPTREVFVGGQWDLIGGAAPSSWQQPGSNGALEMTRDFDIEDEIVFFYAAPRPAEGTVAQYKYFLSLVTAPTWDNGESRGNRGYTFDPDVDLIEDTVEGWDNL